MSKMPSSQLLTVMIGGVIALTIATIIAVFLLRPPVREWGGSQTRTVTLAGEITIPSDFPRRVSEKLRAAIDGYPLKPLAITRQITPNKTHIFFTCEAVGTILYRFSLFEGLSTYHTSDAKTDIINQQIIDLVIAELQTLGPVLSGP